MSNSRIDDPIDSCAVIGLNVRFPKAADANQFWRNLCDGVEGVRFFSDEELRGEGVEEKLLKNPNYVKAGALLEDVEQFDAPFFGYSPREAQIMDPQQRLFLESSWAALEDAGYNPDSFDGQIGVFAGASFSHYSFELYSSPELFGNMDSLQLILGNAESHLATRTSYKLNLKGPSVFVQSACSTSLVAVHLACQSLLNYQCDIALAGGVSVTTPRKVGYMHREGGVLSPDGHCRSFDARAKGTIIGNGIGVVVLRRLEDALKERDNIRAVVRGSAINNDGSAKVGYTAPSVQGQAEVIAEALAVGRVDAASVSYVEAHGTATELGDPIEVEALTQVFRANTERRGFCALGSVKSNFGHLLAAAGVAGFVKTVLALEHKQLPPSLHYEQPNPKIDFENSPFYVNAQLREWEQNGGARRAGVSSFGIGGTNAHIVLEEGPAPEPRVAAAPRWELLPLTAKTSAALERVSENLAAHLDQRPELDLSDVSYTLQVGRRHFNHRRFVVSRGLDQTVAKLAAGNLPARFCEARNAGVVFLFPGQGAQYPGMGRQLYEQEPEFRRLVDECSAQLRPRLGVDLRELLYPRAGAEAEAERQLAETWLTQPALFVTEYALARLWQSWGVQPWGMLGHSIGEYVAACLAGVFKLEDALAVVAERGRLMQALTGGAMVGLAMAAAEVEPLLRGQLAVAAINGPRQVVVSGPEAEVQQLEQELAERGLGGRRLRTSHAFHSPMMEPMLAEFERVLRGVKMAAPQLNYISNVTGGWIKAEEATAASYWVEHARRAVRFGAGLETLLGGERVLVEVGPGETLSRLARRQVLSNNGSGEGIVVSTLGQAGGDEQEALLNAVGMVWLGGVKIDWEQLRGAGHEQRRVVLPAYPFERQRYWVGERSAASEEKKAERAERAELSDWFYLPSWKRALWPRGEAIKAGERWVVFETAGDELSRRVVERLEQAGATVVRVRAGADREVLNEGEYIVRAGERADYEALAEAVWGSGAVQAVVHLWGASEAAETQPDVEWERSQEQGFYSLLGLAQALGRANVTQALKLGVVTRGLQHVAGERQLRPDWATLQGPGKVIPQEYPNVKCVSIDVEAHSATEQTEQIIREVQASTERVVAYRGRERWVQDYEAVKLEGVEDEPAIKRGGVYLITGGTGGIGIALGEWLGKEHAAKVVLTSRRGLVAEEQRERLQAVEAAGGTVLVRAADVSDLAAMRAVVQEVKERWGGIDGVIHAAGVPGGGMIQGKRREQVADVMRGKVEGLRVLERVLREEGQRPAWVAVCSSLAAVRGGLGQVDYCGANSYLDAWAQSAPADDTTRRVSIAWGAWAEAGMAVDAVAKRGYLPCPFWLESSQKQPLAREVTHPLLDQCVRDTETEKAYLSNFKASQLWVLSEHKVAGNATLPGTAYLELVRAAFEDHTKTEGAEIRELFFLSPLMITDGEDKEVHVLLKKEDDGYSFRVTSKPEHVDGESKLLEHARGKISVPAMESAPEFDLAGLMNSLQRAEQPQPGNGNGATSTEENRLVEVGPRWNCLKTVYAGTNEGLALIDLSDEFAQDLNDYKIHPAMLDMAVGVAKKLTGNTGNYLPLSYKRFQMFRPFSKRIYSYIRCRDRKDDSSSAAVLDFDITLLDENGAPLVEIEEYTLRRVHDVALQLKGLSGKEFGQVISNDQMLAGAILTWEGVEAFKRVISRNEITQVAVSPMDIPSMIAKWMPKETNLVEEIGKAQPLRAAHGRPNTGVEYIAPRNEIEAMIAEIWEKLLGIEKIGVQDDFFTLGGDSLLGIQVISRLREVFPVDMSPAMLFERPTIAELSNELIEQLAQKVDVESLDELEVDAR